MRIYFARHGESQANKLKEISNRGLRHGLTLQGRRQAAALAEQLAGALPPVQKVYTSPVLRAIETGVLVAGRLGVEYEVTDALREFDCGIAEGRADAEAWGMWQAVVNGWKRGEIERRVEGGESYLDLAGRVLPFVRGLVSAHAGTDWAGVCIAHGGVYYPLLPQLLVNVSPEELERRGLGYTTCVTAEERGGKLVCVAWNGLTYPG
jgi:broad specificity phosphatase PhoE